MEAKAQTAIRYWTICQGKKKKGLGKRMEIMGETEAQVEGNKWRQEQKRMSVINPDVNLFHLHQVHQETKANSLERKLSKMKPGSLLSNRSRPQKKKEQGRDCS